MCPISSSLRSSPLKKVDGKRVIHTADFQLSKAHSWPKLYPENLAAVFFVEFLAPLTPGPALCFYNSTVLLHVTFVFDPPSSRYSLPLVWPQVQSFLGAFAPLDSGKRFNRSFPLAVIFMKSFTTFVPRKFLSADPSNRDRSSDFPP